MRLRFTVKGARVALALALAVSTGSAFAWVYPEHRDIALLAVEGLDGEHKAEFDRLWQEARGGNEQRLCPKGADTEQGVTPSCIDWAALSAIAGDHSCSSKGMMDTVLGADWILVVADVAAQLKLDLANIPITAAADQLGSESDIISDAQRRLADEATRAKRVNALRTADIRLQRADPGYATRAGSNNAHFLLARPGTDTDVLAYAELTLQPGSPLNAIGVYAWFHLSALQKASRLAREQLTPSERRSLVRAMLFDEAFALHFLEDAYAAGHVAGTWGNASQRQGTHDRYNQSGLEVFTWNGGSRSRVLMGDAHLRPQDAAVAAKDVRKSLEQVLDTASGKKREVPYRPSAPAAPDAFDVCRNNTFPAREEGLRAKGEYKSALEETLLPTPVPGLGPGLGALPRFRSEVGPFMGLSGSIEARRVNGGFVPSQTSSGWIGGLDLAFRAGFGLEGVMNESGDGLVFGQVGFRVDAASTNKFSDSTFGASGGNLSAAIPARSGISTRIRMPFYLIPGDLLFMSPLFLVDREAYTKMAVTAGNGGLIPWQAGWATPIGRFQFVLGRELGVTFYGLGGEDQLLAPAPYPGGIARTVNFKSVSYELPILEYRPYRAFSMNQSSSILFQLFAGVDVPYDYSVSLPRGAPPMNLDKVYFLGLRMVFDWRYYR
jgi:hypothetical protein